MPAIAAWLWASTLRRWRLAPPQSRRRPSPRHVSGGAMSDIDRKEVAILRVLDQAQGPMGAGRIAKELRGHGIELEERAVRYHLEALDEMGLTEPLGRPGRRITVIGRQELRDARVAEKVDMVHSKLEAFAYQTTVSPRNGQGKVALNISFVPRTSLTQALEIMRPILNSDFATSRRVRIFQAGDRIGSRLVPADMAGVGTVCSVTLNGILLKAGIPVQSLFGGLLSIEGGDPKRFTEVVHYGWTSLDPVEVFIKSGATTVSAATAKASGVVGASFREFPAVAREHVIEELERIRPWGIGGVIAVGSPSAALLEVEVPPGRCGLVIAAGLNPVAAVEEAGVPTASHALTSLFDYQDLVDVNEVAL
ncbi:MAG: DUF128 domain-containing protein [Armatimonadia bacterium]|nr:DUF128 domain-containing protein [Armatimonadia bacterium]